MLSDELKARIEELDAKIDPLVKERSRVERDYRDALSREWVKANEVRSEDVQLSYGAGVPWHGDFYTFGKWLAESKCRKRWCEWNGGIYSTAEAMAGIMANRAPGDIEHVREASKC